jgi:serpin B
VATLLEVARLALALSAQGPDTTATVAGTARLATGEPIAGAQIHVIGTPHGVVTDSLGRYELRGLSPGVTRLVIRLIGYTPSETVLSLRPGERRVWDVVFGEPPRAAAAAAESARAAAGALDSLAAGLVTTDTTLAFAFERFGIELLRAASRLGAADSSRIVSPMSAGQVLGLALAGARDSTALAVHRALDLGPLTSSQLATRVRRFNERARSRDDMTLRIANAVWVDTVASLQASFVRVAREDYAAVARRVALAAPEIVGLLNAWADSATSGLIRQVRTDPFGRGIEIVLSNAVYFKGRWLAPFDSALTEPRPFTTVAGERVSTPTMEHRAWLAYTRAAGYQVVRIPYAAGLTAMYVVLPDSGVAPATILDTLARDGWPVPHPRHVRRDVHLRLPRLHAERATDLRRPLSDLGMAIAFDSLRADFGGMVEPRPGNPPPCPPLSSGVRLDACTRYRLHEAMQHVYLDVDERGTEAAAVTTVSVEAVVTSAPPPPIPFYVDRPFLFAIRDERTGAFLFMGLVVHPRQ